MAEAKVGALFLITIVLIAVVAAYLGQYTLGARVDEIIVHFADVQGLQAGGEVRLAGVKIGRVVNIALAEHEDYPEQPVAVRLGIDQTVNLYDTDQFVVEQGGLVGEQYISVRRPTAEQIVQKWGADYVPHAIGSGADRPGGKVVGFAALAHQTQELMDEANTTLQAIRTTYADKGAREQLHQILVNVNRATAQANKIADQALILAETLVRSGETAQPQIAQILADVSQAAGDIRATSGQIRLTTTAFINGGMPQHIVQTTSNISAASEDIKEVSAAAREMIATPEAKQQVQSMRANLAAASESVKALTARMAEIVGDEQTVANLRATAANLRESSDNLQVITERAEQFFTKEGNLENIEATLENVRMASDQGVAVTRKADRALDRVEGTMDRLGELAGHFQPRCSDGYVDLQAVEERGLRADFNWNLQYGDNPLDFWRVGVGDVGVHEVLTLQKSLPLSSRAWGRLGLIQSKAGLGLDYRLSSYLTLETETYDPEDIQVDLRGIYKMNPQWSLLLGVGDCFGSKDPFIGTRGLVTFRNQRKDKTD